MMLVEVAAVELMIEMRQAFYLMTFAAQSLAMDPRGSFSAAHLWLAMHFCSRSTSFEV